MADTVHEIMNSRGQRRDIIADSYLQMVPAAVDQKINMSWYCQKQ